jgi:hypothetical protein
MKLRLADRLSKIADDEYFRNDEALYFRQKQLPTVTPQQQQQQLQTATAKMVLHSIPVPLLSPQERAKLESEAHLRSHTDARAVQAARSRDLLNAKLEALPATTEKWHAETVGPTRQREETDDATFIQRFNVRMTSAAIPR